MLFTTVLFATHAERNVCCHYCRVSENRFAKKTIAYLPCLSCSKVYCERCITKKMDLTYKQIIAIEKAGSIQCDCCQKKCCCRFKLCTREHEHCFTYRRTLQRHSLRAHKWVKSKPEMPAVIKRAYENDSSDSCIFSKIKKEKQTSKKRPRHDSSSCSYEDDSSEEFPRRPKKKLVKIKKEELHSEAPNLRVIIKQEEEEMDEDLLIVADDPSEAIASFHLLNKVSGDFKSLWAS